MPNNSADGDQKKEIWQLSHGVFDASPMNEHSLGKKSMYAR